MQNGQPHLTSVDEEARTEMGGKEYILTRAGVGASEGKTVIDGLVTKAEEAMVGFGFDVGSELAREG